MSFSGKVVLVTGAASGIGAATTKLFAREGAAVVMVDKDDVNLQLVEEQNKRDGHTTFAITANVSDDDDTKKIIEVTIDKFRKIDVLVNCAGLIRFGTILDGKLIQSYDELMKINLRAVMQMTCQAAPHLIKTKGNIVNIASINAHLPAVDYQAYCISKIGVKHFTRSAALELAPHGVRVNSISPGTVKTNLLGNSGLENCYDAYIDRTALKKICEPEEIADLVMYLASDKAKSITGTDILNDNGRLLK